MARPMSFIVAIWLTLVTFVVSVPVVGPGLLTHAHAEGTTSFQVLSSVQNKRHPVLEHYRTLAKYNIPIPVGLQKAVAKVKSKAAKTAAAAKAQGSSLPSTSTNQDQEWLSPAGIGLPAQQFYMDFDTGSSDTWVLSTDTERSDVHGQTLYDPSKSTTSQKIRNCTWSIIYGDFSSSSGICYSDTFTLGDIAIPDMIIESAQEASWSFTEDKMSSGLVGLAGPAIAQTTPAQRVLLEYLPEVLKQPIFTTDFRHNSTDGSINFGWIDDSLYGSTIDYINADTTAGYWQVLMTAFSYQGSTIQYQFKSPIPVILDTGTTMLYAPDQAAETYHQQIRGAYFSYEEYGYVLPCNSTPPDFDWVIGDMNKQSIYGIVPGSYMTYQELDDIPGFCYSGLQSLGSFSELGGILGDIWLKAGFQVWNFGDTPQFGHAPKLLGPSTPGTSSDKLHATFRQKRVVIV